MNEWPEWFENIEIGLAILDSHGRFIKINKSFSNLIGYTNDEIIEKYYKSITHPDDLEFNQKEFSKIVLGNEESISLVKRYITKTGNIIWARVILTRISEEKILKQIIVISDVKEQLKKTNNKIEVVESVSIDLLLKKYWWRFFQIIFIAITTFCGWLLNAGLKMHADSARIDKIEQEILYKLEKDGGKENDSKARDH